MRCQSCKHFYADGRDPYELSAEARGMCTLDPRWRDVGMAHFCGRGEHTESYPFHADANRQTERAESAWQAAEREKQRAIKAEKGAKALRAEVRDLKRALRGAPA